MMQKIKTIVKILTVIYECDTKAKIKMLKSNDGITKCDIIKAYFQ